MKGLSDDPSIDNSQVIDKEDGKGQTHIQKKKKFSVGQKANESKAFNC